MGPRGVWTMRSTLSGVSVTGTTRNTATHVMENTAKNIAMYNANLPAYFTFNSKFYDKGSQRFGGGQRFWSEIGV